MFTRASTFVLIMLCMMLMATSISAQTERHTGFIGDNVDDAEYPISLESGQTVSVSTVATSGNLDTYIGLRDSSDNLVVENDDMDSTTLDSSYTYTATDSGEYTVIVSNIRGTSGDYVVTITIEGEAPSATAQPVQTTNSPDAVTYTGEMNDNLPDALYPVMLQAGQIITVSTVATSGNLDPYIGLQDTSGELVVENDDRDDTTLDSYFIYSALETGEYTIVISNIRNTSGDYAVTVEVSAAEVEAATPEPQGIQFTGFMSDDVADDTYPIQVQAGQTVRVDVVTTSGNLDPYSALTSPSGDRVIENDDRTAFTLDAGFSYVVKEGGEYTVIVSNIRETSGDYRLTIGIEGGGTQPATNDVKDPEAQITENTNTLNTPDAEYTGFLSDTEEDARYPIKLEVGQAVMITADATGGDLDPFLMLINASGDRVAENDDKDDNDLNSELVFITPDTAEYTLVVTNYPETSGNYRVTLTYISAGEAEATLRVSLSGAPLFYDTENFRIHYTAEGKDAATEAFVQLVGSTLEEVRNVQLNQLAWAIPPDDGAMGGDGKYDVYLMDLLGDAGGGELGLASPELPSGDNPNTETTERWSVASYVMLDNDYAPEQIGEDEDPITMMRATAAHEFHHAIQFGYDLNDDSRWYYEATSTWMETVTFPEDQDATGYVTTLFDYPEVCLGADGESDPTEGGLMYGEWLFIQSLVDAHDDQLPIRLWENIGKDDGWKPLNDTLALYNDTLLDAARRYRLQNLLRGYALAPAFDDARVWQENSIDKTGKWSFSGKGIQELAANYYKIDLGTGLYRLQADKANMELWLVGINGAEASVFALNENPVFDAGAFEQTYLMVFNPNDDYSLEDCHYAAYTLSVERATDSADAPSEAAFTLDAQYFESLE